MTTIVPMPQPSDPEPRGPAWLEKRPPLPTRAELAAKAHWWRRTGSRKLGVLALHAPVLLVREVKPTLFGIGRVWTAWAEWRRIHDVHHVVKAHGEGDKAVQAMREIEAARGGRRKLSLAMVVILTVAGWWGWTNYPVYVIAAGAVLLVMLNLIGRQGPGKPEPVLPKASGPILREGVPLTQLTLTMLNTFEAKCGMIVEVVVPMRYDPARQQYRITVACADEITPESLRDVERGLGAADHSIRSLATAISTNREIVIRDGDPLAKTPPPPWIDTGTRSLMQPLDIGVSMTENPFEVSFAGQHIKVIAGTGGGKSSWFLRICIDRISACRDVELWGIDLTSGPELPLWRGVIKKRAFDPEAADALLDEALAEIARRAKILAKIAESDDPEHADTIEWHSKLGDWIVIPIDEFSTLAEFDGKGGRLDLLGKCKQIIRTGRKHGVSLVMFAQRTGNDDFGSSVMTSQANTTIAGPCSPDDAVRLFGKEMRDAGWTPHLLEPGNAKDPHDAGKCFYLSGSHRSADVYRAYWPMAPSEVKRRAALRIAEGFGTASSPADEDTQDAVEVPAALSLLERAFTDYEAERLPTSMILEYAVAHDEKWTDMELADALRPFGVTTHKDRNEFTPGKSVMCYRSAEVLAALGAL